MTMYDLLTAKGIEVTEEESVALHAQWEGIQALKQDLDDVLQNELDIALCHAPKEGK
ncbi:hypothetical protein M3212_20755 [Alkalihalobacillus oceani]|uniref:hypothetical protein n=1 Tax=Halalkalibacter oceani TaxID=1653776 RepID=UPI00203BBF8C|nr:hypothetical protein [Halalkalibacter oceani]MCM3763152.1 hypothetical protein [Halalkalibacter oceani]